MKHLRIRNKNIYAIISLIIIYFCLCLFDKANYQISNANTLLKLTFTAIKFPPRGLDLLSPTFNMIPLIVGVYFYIDFFTEDFHRAYVYIFTRFVNKNKWIGQKIAKLATLILFQELILISMVGIFAISITNSVNIADFLLGLLKILTSRYFMFFSIALLASSFALMLNEVLGYVVFLVKLIFDQSISLLLLVLNNQALNYLHNFITTSQSNYLWYSDATRQLNVQPDLYHSLLLVPQMSILLSLICCCLVSLCIYFILIKYLKNRDLIDVLK